MAVRWPRVFSGGAIIAVASSAGWVSYTHIYELTLTLGGGASAAVLMPIGVDGLITAGSVVLLQGGTLGWVCLGPGVAISLFANIEAGLPHGWLSALWSAVPSVSFALASFVLERHLRGRGRGRGRSRAAAPALAAERTERAPEAPVRAVAAAPAHPEPGSPEAVYASLTGRGQLPSVRAIMRDLHVGAAKAKAVRERLEQGLLQDAA